MRMPLPRSIVGQTLMMAFLVALIGAATSLLLLFSMPPPSTPPLSLYELGRLARGLPIAAEESPSSRIVAAPAPTSWQPDADRSMLLTRLLVARTHLAPADVRVEVAPSRRYPDGARLLARQMRMYEPSGINPYVFDSLRLAVRRPDGRWLIFERDRPSPVEAWRRLSAGWILAGLALVLPIAILYANRIARPIRRFANASVRLGQDGHAEPIAADGPAEIVEAATAFNRMAERIRRHIAERSTTISAVAHDLRTPLARLRFRVEGAAEPIRGRAIADIDEMEAMIAATLRLVREEFAPAPMEVLDLAGLLVALVEGYRESGRSVALQAVSRLQVKGDAQAIRRMIENLVNNALRFGGDATVAAAIEDGVVCVSVLDRGPGLDEGAIARAFDPFWRGEGSRNRGTGGTGLGLTIVRTIARRHGGEATLEAREGGGLVAQVTLPTA